MRSLGGEDAHPHVLFRFLGKSFLNVIPYVLRSPVAGRRLCGLDVKTCTWRRTFGLHYSGISWNPNRRTSLNPLA